MVSSVGNDIVAVDGEESDARSHFHVDQTVAVAGKHVSCGLVDFQAGGNVRRGIDSQFDAQVIGLLFLLLQFPHHFVVRVNADFPVWLLECQQVGLSG